MGSPLDDEVFESAVFQSLFDDGDHGEDRDVDVDPSSGLAFPLLGIGNGEWGAPATAKESKHKVARIAYLNGAIQQLQRFLRRETEILAFDSANGNVRSPSLRAFCLV